MRSNYRLLLLFLLALPCAAQDAPSRRMNLVLTQGDGAISVTLEKGWTLQQLSLLDHNSRPILLLRNEALDMDLSYILFPNDTGAPTAESCRDAVIKATIKSVSESSSVLNVENSVRPGADGSTLAVTAYFIPNYESVPVHQENLFGFLGDAHNCAEIHISQTHYTPDEETRLFDQLKLLTYDAAYTPVTRDYLAMASIYYEQQSYGPAAWYYTTALAVLAPGPDARNTFRFASDQLILSLGIGGDLKGSRLVAQKAIAADPDYAMSYYLLADNDAEEGHADAARQHLQQAFDRKANLLPGEKLPDPTQDDSLLKLQKNKKFWAFVQELQSTR